MPNNDVYQVRFNIELYNQKLINIIHVKQVGADGTGDAILQLAEEVEADWKTKLQNIYSEDVVIRGISIKGVGGVASQYEDFDWSVPGLVTGDSYPPNMNALISVYAEGQLPRYRGRNYYSGIAEPSARNGIIVVDYFTPLGILANLYKTDLVDGPDAWTFAPCLWSTAFPTGKVIIESNVNTRLINLRSRTIGVGS